MKGLRKRARALGLVAAVAGLAVYSTVAFADNVVDTVNDSAGTFVEIANGGTTGAIGVKVNGAASDGCDLDNGKASQLTVKISGSPGAVSVLDENGDPLADQTLTFDDCQTFKYFKLTSTAAGDHTISATLTQSGGTGTGDFRNQFGFTLRVGAAGGSGGLAAPTVDGALSGGTLGSGGWYTAAPTATWTLGGGAATSYAGHCASPDATTFRASAAVPSTDTATGSVTCSATNATGTGSKELTYKLDSSKPEITASLSGGTLGTSPWYVAGPVALTWTVTDPTSGIASSTGCGPQTVSADSTGETFTCQATNGAGLVESVSQTIQLDASKPQISPVVAGGTLGDNDWYVGGSVGLTWVVTDPHSGIASSTGCGPQTVSGDTPPAGTTYTCSATNGAGLQDSAGQTIKYDSTKPSSTVSGLGAASSYALGGTLPTPGCDGSDATSGIADGFEGNLTQTAFLTANGVGTATFVCNGAKDNAGNVQTVAGAAQSYSVQYARDGGILQPINPDGNSVFNIKRAVPVKFKLLGDAPSGFDRSGWTLKRENVACGTEAWTAESTVDAGTTSTNTGLRYDPTADQYIANATLNGATVGKCYVFVVGLDDNTEIESPKFKVGK